MAISFPTTPALNDTYTEGSTTWKWTGRGWAVLPAEDVTFNELTATTFTTDSIAAETVEVGTSIDVPTLNVTGALNVTGTSSGISVSVALNDLTNVSAPSPTEGQVLKYISGTWSPASDLSGGGAGGGIGLADLSVTTLAAEGSGSLTYSNTTGTFTFKPADLSTFATTNYVDTAISNIAGVDIGGANTQVQYNDNGTLGGSSAFTFNSTTSTVTVGNITVGDTTTGLLSATGLVDFTNSTQSTSSSTGAFVVTGGAGIGGQLNVAGASNTFSGDTASTSINTGTVVVTGGVGVSGEMHIGSTVSSSTTPTNDEHLTNKAYVDSKALALSVAFGA
jgi:hypothetical protein